MERSPLSIIYFLDRKMGILPILIYLHDRGPAPKTAISSFMKYRHETIDKALQLLDRYGLVSERRDEWFPYRRTFALTSFGRKLVETPICDWSPLLDQTATAGG